jgi:FMN phosphatase YigB (HAD superfamily)
MIGDDYELDIVPANSAGMITVFYSLIKSGYPKANFVIESMSALPSVLKIVEEEGYEF